MIDLIVPYVLLSIPSFKRIYISDKFILYPNFKPMKLVEIDVIYLKK